MDRVAFLGSIRYEQTASVGSGDELDSAASEVSIGNMDESIAEIPSTVNQDSRGIVGEASFRRVVGIPSAAVVSEPNPKRASREIGARAAVRPICEFGGDVVQNNARDSACPFPTAIRTLSDYNSALRILESKIRDMDGLLRARQPNRWPFCQLYQNPVLMGVWAATMISRANDICGTSVTF
jgi:hypothetical protein